MFIEENIPAVTAALRQRNAARYQRPQEMNQPSMQEATENLRQCLHRWSGWQYDPNRNPDINGNNWQRIQATAEHRKHKQPK